MSNLLLETKNLTKVFGKQKAVDGISLKVPKNSIYGLLEPNGAGKSTTLKIICGLLHKTSGEILFDSHNWSRNDLDFIGCLIESPPIYENLTAKENLKVRTLLLGLPDSRIDEVLNLVELSDTGNKKSGHFSLRMKQRLGIAIALLNNPKLLILDEPTNGLDPLGIEKLRNLIKTFPEKNIKVIISSHILGEVKQMADHIGIIHEGKLKYQDIFHPDEDLEKLFIDVIKNEKRPYEM